jgi:hypothetical protein
MCLTLVLSCDFFLKNESKGFSSASQVQEEVFQEIFIENKNQNNPIILKQGKTIQSRFSLPNNFERITINSNTFGQYLRQLPLKPHGSSVTYYDGTIKSNNNVYLAVVNQSIGKHDLHQCADAIMRMKAEYHWNNKEYEKIHFNLTNGFRVDYSKWITGKRVKVIGNKTEWKDSKPASNTYKDFWSYMEFIFSYAGTASLSKELIKVNWDDMHIGDMLIKGGYPGHAVIVVDMAANKSTGEIIYMLAQSYMPAQEAQIICNPKNQKSPWYFKNSEGEIVTPEWTFGKSDLMRFRD